MPDNERTPVPALLLGYGGLIPFIGGATLQVLSPDPRWLAMLSAYGAVILSFVGALHWGYAVRDAARGESAWWGYGWSVLPALAAWVCLLLPDTTGVLLLAAGLVGCLVVDEILAPRMALPAWLLPLRRALTAGGAASLLVAGWT
jgi:hypothetical protein